MFIPTLNSTDLADDYVPLQHKLHRASSPLSVTRQNSKSSDFERGPLEDQKPSLSFCSKD